MPSIKPTNRIINRITNKPLKSDTISFLIPILAILIVMLLVYMVWDIAKRPIPDTTEEGFVGTNSSSKKSKLGNIGTSSKSSSKSSSNKYNKAKQNKAKQTKAKSKNGPNKSKLEILKHGKYNPNDDLKNYGMDSELNNSDEEEDDLPPADNKLEKTMTKMGSELGKNVLADMMAKRESGKRDNFKNVINEVDNINPGAFDLSSIGGTIRRYNENFNNRLNYAKAKNEGNNLEATMAQGKVIFDEFKKIFLFTDMFT